MKKSKSGPRPKLVNTRKAIRKEKRQQKKIHRQEHYNKKKLVGDVKKFEPGKFVKLTTVQHETSKKDKKKSKKQPLFLDILNKERQKDMNVTEKLKSEMEEQRKQMLLKANEDEDKVIKKLEKQLGLNKSKKKNNYFADDGLDYLLEICDRTTSEQIVAAEKHLADVGDSDFEEDLAMVTGKELPKEKVKSKEKTTKINNLTECSKDDDSMGSDENSLDEDDDDDDGSDKDEDFSDMENVENDYDSEISEDEGKNQIKPDKKEKTVSENDLNKVFSDDEVSHISGDESEDGFDLESGKKTPEDIKNKEKPDIWEDIYGRKRDKDGNVIKEEKGVYIPPHLRNKDSTSDKDLAQLKRQIKSILNKVSGSNLHWACASLENLYSSHSRRAVSGALCAQWVCAAVPHAAAPDRLLAEHAALLALLHANVATEVGAYFVEELCLMFDKMVDSELPVEDKRLDNLTACLAYLYSFKIFHSGLMYDILYRLLHEVSEKRCECALRALRCAGAELRRAQPAALQGFIHDTHAKVAHYNDKAAAGSRIKFLLEVLLAVKNNNLSKIPQYDPTYVQTLRKTCRSILRPGHTVTTLTISLEDLLRAEERGKWWIVGSAWAGSRPPPAAAPSAAPAADHKLLELARKQRMNTDVRRNIFCVIMSAQDYTEALQRLQALALRGPQRREAAHVALACCLQESAYNRYYALLAAELCRRHRQHQLAFQFSIWDKIKELESASKQVLTNLAQFLVHLIMEKALPLSVLKIIQFSDLNKKSVRFMRQILLAVIMNDDLQLSLEVFHRISKSPKLHMFRESLRLFIQHFLIKNAGKKSTVLSEDEMATLKERASEVDKILTLHESKLKF